MYACKDVRRNQYLKWGVVEAATCSLRIKAYRGTHIERQYQRLAPGKGHSRAVVAVARHLAEASYWMLRKRQPYKDSGTASSYQRRGLSQVRPGSAKRETRLTGTAANNEMARTAEAGALQTCGAKQS